MSEQKRSENSVKFIMKKMYYKWKRGEREREINYVPLQLCQDYEPFQSVITKNIIIQKSIYKRLYKSLYL